MQEVKKRRYLIYISEDAAPEYRVNESAGSPKVETVMIFARTFGEVNNLRRQAETNRRE